MTSYNKTNPTHGKKVTKDSRCKTDIKHEYAGPITSDSLAAESLRSGGHFAEGNPADISSVKGYQSTFAVNENPGGPYYHEIKPGHKLHEDEKIELGRKGGLQEDLKTKSVHTGTSGGGTQRHEGYEGRESESRDIRDTTRPTKEKKDKEPHGPHGRPVPSGENLKSPRLATPPGGEGVVPGWSASGPGGTSGGHGPYPGDAVIEGLVKPREYNPDKFAPSTNLPYGTVGDPETKKRETPDWNQIPKETVPPPVGGPEDPGRLAELHFAKTTTKLTGPQHDAQDKDENPYKALEPETRLGTV